MLTKNDKSTLRHELQAIFHNYVDTNQCQMVDDLTRLVIGVLDMIRRSQESVLDVADDASCGLPDHPPIGDTGTEVRCPNCRRSL